LQELTNALASLKEVINIVKPLVAKVSGAAAKRVATSLVRAFDKACRALEGRRYKTELHHVASDVPVLLATLQVMVQ
jgi:hypothetical protein